MPGTADSPICARTSNRNGDAQPKKAERSMSTCSSQISQALNPMPPFDDSPNKITSKISVSRPQTHRLPTLVIWAITLTIPTVVAGVNYMIVVCEHFLNDKKFQWMQEAFNAGGVGAGTLVLVCISMLLAGSAAALVSWIGPLCAGSGIPEAKGYLNGNSIPHMFSKRNLVVRTLGIILSGAAGYPIGREGPMVCIGGTVGFQVVDKLAIHWVRRWVDLHVRNDEQEINMALIVDEERFAYAKRIGCALGGAAGIATAFNAPIGGILYMFEEVTVTSWPPELTFRTFVCTNVAATLARGLLNLTHKNVHHLVIFDDDAEKTDDDVSWHWGDVPFFVMLALFIGFFSALFTRCLLATWSAREWFKKSRRCRRWKKHIKALEAVLFAGFCALTLALVPLLFECVKEPTALSRRNLRFVRHDCKPGEHREVANFVLSGAEEAVKQLFARDDRSDHHVGTLLVACGAYATLACGMPGLPVPMGNFVPCLLIGALLGRTLGELVQELQWGLSHPGVYALVGSAAMLSGFTHMTLAIVVLLVEAAADLSLVSPIMMGIFVASLASKCVNHHAYDEVLILKKGVPFLEDEVPHEMDHEGTTAGDLCEIYPDEAILPCLTSATDVLQALNCQTRKYMDFPVVDGTRCLGFTTRSRLQASVEGMHKSRSKFTKMTSTDTLDSYDNQITERHLQEEDKKLGITRFVSGMAAHAKDFIVKDTKDIKEVDSIKEVASSETEDGKSSRTHAAIVPVHRIMDRSPYTIVEDMPAPRFYPLFIRAGVNAAAVVTKTGEFVGVLQRHNLISQSREAHLPRSTRRDFSGRRHMTQALISSTIQEKTRMIHQLRMEVEELKATCHSMATSDGSIDASNYSEKSDPRHDVVDNSASVEGANKDDTVTAI